MDDGGREAMDRKRAQYLLGPDRVRLDTRQVPAMMGIDPMCGGWTLWQELKGRYTRDADTGRVPDLDEEAHEVVVDWIVRHGQLGVPARRAKGEVHADEVPLRGTPDIVIPAAAHWGAGPGFGQVVWIRGREWAREWRGRRVRPTVPPAPRAEAEAMMMVLGVEWGVVVPQIGRERVRSPILVRSDPEVRAGITRTLWELACALDEDRAPPPDVRADMACLQALARVAPAPGGEEADEPPLSSEEQRAVAEDMQVLVDAQARFDEARAEMGVAADRRAEALARLLERTGRRDTVTVGSRTVRRTVRPRAPEPVGAEDVDLVIETETGGVETEIGVRLPAHD